MNQLMFGGLLSSSAPTAPIIGIAFIALFAIVGFIVGAEYEGMNAPSTSKTQNNQQN